MSNSADFGDVRTAQKASDSGGVRVTTSNELLGRRFHAALVAATGPHYVPVPVEPAAPGPV